MKRYLRSRISRWWATSLFASVFALSSLVWSSSPTFAAACNPSLALDASGGPVSCDMLIGAQINGGLLELENDSAARVAGSPFTLAGASITAVFSFTSVVDDHRGNTNGWRLLASSAGISNGTTILPLSLMSLDTSSACVVGTCSPPNFTPITPLTTTPTSFLSTGNATHTIIVDGDYSNKINGQFMIPPGAPSGSYTGIITIALSNTY